MNPSEIKDRIYIPQEDRVTSIKTSEAEFIYNFLTEKGISATLEIGFAYAMSASHIIAATQKEHIVIDPFQYKYKNLGLENIKSLGFENYLVFFNDYSYNILPLFVRQGRLFEFIFIDGDHKFDGEFIDFFYADLLLTKGGYILMHDTWMRSTQLVMSFIKTNRRDYEYIATAHRNLALFRKIGNDSRNGMHFREFYTFKSLLVYNVISWLTTGKNSFLKRIVFAAKERLK